MKERQAEELQPEKKRKKFRIVLELDYEKAQMTAYDELEDILMVMFQAERARALKELTDPN